MKAPFHRSVRRAALACAFAPLLAWSAAAPAQAESVVTVAMTAGDIPDTTGNPDQGFEGFRFVGYNLYDGLALWDLSQQRQAVRHQAGPRDVLGGRSQQPPAAGSTTCARA